MKNNSNTNYSDNLGRLITNLHSLEVSIRDFLFTNDFGLEAATVHVQSLRELKIGQSVSENHFTNYNSLRTLIVKYNEQVSTFASELIVDDDIVNLRDALAHGRVFSFEPSSPSILLKFSKPKNGNTEVEFMAIMTRDWFDEQIKWTQNELKKVVEASYQALTNNTQ